jgi:ABC-type nitrate/sulfonate/bicarbonate transport system substrate-binding protein
MRFTKTFAAAAVALGLSGLAAAPALSQDLSVAIPGNPPIWAGMVAHVALEQGIYAKYGFNDVKIQALPVGPQATAAAGQKEFDIGIGPTSPAAVAISNAGLPVTGIAGQNFTDWMIASTDGSTTDCEDLEGQSVAVDRRGGIRFIQLATLLRTCGLTPGDVSLLEVSSRVKSALIAGDATFGVLHAADDIPAIRKEGVDVHTVVIMNDINPKDHYVMHFVNNDNLAADRDKYVRATAAHIEAFRFMSDPANNGRIVEIVVPQNGLDPDVALEALFYYQGINYFPQNHNGMDQDRVQTRIAVQKRVGNIENDPVTYDDMTDVSIYEEALALVGG